MKDILEINMHNIRGIKELRISLNLEPDIYAITGQNASGKSTLIASIACLFYQKILYRLLITKEKSGINYSRNDKRTSVYKQSIDSWNADFYNLDINGFYEGSLIHGNRFLDTNYDALFKAKRKKENDLIEADKFIKENLGKIIRDDKNYYNRLYRLDEQPQDIKKKEFKGTPYYLIENNSYGIDEIISQFNLSTGENLLISLLHSINYFVVNRRLSDKKFIILLDEIELGLHPSSLRRLFTFLKSIVKEYNIAVYFSTHSIELLRHLNPNNIYYLEKGVDTTVDVLNPCYPAYATKYLYQHDRYDLLILVEDDLAKAIIDELLIANNFKTNKLINILPVGGWTNVLKLHNEVLQSKLLGFDVEIFSILDGDAKTKVEVNISKGMYKNLNLSYLPVESLEKYLKNKLVDNPDNNLVKYLDDNLTTTVPIQQLIKQYKESDISTKDNDGKNLLQKLIVEIKKIGKSEEYFVGILSKYIVKNEDINKLVKRIEKILKYA